MPRRSVPLCEGEYYHLYNRGNNRERIFRGPGDYAFFLQRVHIYLTPILDVVAYCLMPTHYHLLVFVRVADLSHRMQLLSISYTKAMNARYERVGSLFQGAFHAKHVDQDSYLLHLSAYIHRNPVEARLVKVAEEWEFSSYREFIGIREGTLPKPQPILSHFPSRKVYRVYVEVWAPPEDDSIEHLIID
jgi:REP element-mobilizing transposase RayT